ncbi:MAG: TonB family protein [Paludibacteraceae bacterium]|nr:TonB family protein [Paludibacteraceae bacterium]
MKNESKIWGLTAAVLAMVLLFLFLWFYYLDAPFVPEEEGIEVALGDYVEGGADVYEPAEAEPAVVTPAQPAPAAPSSNSLMVQDDEESLALQKQVEEDRKRQAAEEALREKQRQEELARIEAERIEREKAAAEKAAREQAARDKAQNLMGGAFGNNSGSAGSGNSTGDTHQGSKTGTNPAAGGSGGPRVSGTLANRGGKLPKPQSTGSAEGIVVIRVRVNAAGKVVDAKFQQSGSNTADQSLIDAALTAAKQATFSQIEEGAEDVTGTITYNFTLK